MQAKIIDRKWVVEWFDERQCYHMPSLTLADRVGIMEHYIGKRVIDAIVVGPKTDTTGLENRAIVQTPLDAADVPYRHDRVLLRNALEKAIQTLG